MTFCLSPGAFIFLEDIIIRNNLDMLKYFIVSQLEEEEAEVF
jgi:hypothetical protein